MNSAFIILLNFFGVILCTYCFIAIVILIYSILTLTITPSLFQLLNLLRTFAMF